MNDPQDANYYEWERAGSMTPQATRDNVRAMRAQASGLSFAGRMDREDAQAAEYAASRAPRPAYVARTLSQRLAGR
jgi:hypothetical protein